jgi:hypothetical protein
MKLNMERTMSKARVAARVAAIVTARVRAEHARTSHRISWSLYPLHFNLNPSSPEPCSLSPCLAIRHAVDYIMDTFPIAKHKDEAAQGHPPRNLRSSAVRPQAVHTTRNNGVYAMK